MAWFGELVGPSHVIFEDAYIPTELVPLAYGIKKLTILCTIEDDKVSVEELFEKIKQFKDYVRIHYSVM